MVNNYGDRVLDLGLWDPGPLHGRNLWLVNGGLIDYLLTGMTLQVWDETGNLPHPKLAKVAVWRRDAFSLESAAKDKKSSPKASWPF